jgi:murein DD-endopeptidase MepM/ murein hydrolase activator NlpD
MKKTLIFLLLMVSVYAYSLDFLPPVLLRDYVVTSDFGFRKTVLGGDDDTIHKGIDFAPLSKKSDMYVYAAADGKVITHYPPPGWYGGRYYEGHPIYGALIVINHGNGWYTLYSHMSQTKVSETGSLSIVKKGQPIGIVGSTGQSTGIHLHFEVLLDPIKALGDSEIERLRMFNLKLSTKK